MFRLNFTLNPKEILYSFGFVHKFCLIADTSSLGPISMFFGEIGKTKTLFLIEFLHQGKDANRTYRHIFFIYRSKCALHGGTLPHRKLFPSKSF